MLAESLIPNVRYGGGVMVLLYYGDIEQVRICHYYATCHGFSFILGKQDRREIFKEETVGD